MIALLALAFSGPVSADEGEIRKELQMLRKRVEELEGKLKERETGKKPQLALPESEKKGVAEILMEKFGTLSIHGGAVGFYQGNNETQFDGTTIENNNGLGYVADLELAFKPIERGEVYVRLHAGRGKGADRDLEDLLFANLNTIADDNPEDESDHFDLLEAYYTQTFWDEKAFLLIGKTEPVILIDDNAFANAEDVQFVGKPFVNDPVLDSEDEFGPLFAGSVSMFENLAFVLLYQSITAGGSKSEYDKVFNEPFIAAQLVYSPTISGFEGNYRLYAWVALYDHPKLTDEEKSEKGWGVGVSFDQKVHSKIGLFLRAGYHNETVYDVPWFWSIGSELMGLVPGREEDTIGIGLAGLIGNDDLEFHDTEYHLEAYYRIALGEYFSITPDLQYVVNPRGDCHGDDVFAGMLRAVVAF